MDAKKWILNMLGYVDSYEKDSAGNDWYMAIQSACGLSGKIGNKIDFDMRCATDKAQALEVCVPLSTSIDKLASMCSRGKFYVVDSEGNESKSNLEIESLLNAPNILQSKEQFLKLVESNLKLYGFCPVYTLRGTKKGFPKAMWVIPPTIIHIIPTGGIFNQMSINGIIDHAYVEWNGKQIDLQENEYFIIYDSDFTIGKEIQFKSVTDSLSTPVSNWMSQMIARNTLIVDGGPKGVLCNDDTSEAGNAALTSTEQNSLNSKFKRTYGLVKKAFSILVTRAKLKWVPLNYDSEQLKLHEEDESCSNMIYNKVGVNPNLFSAESKYENQEAAERKAYASTVIPDSENIASILTKVLCPEGKFIKIDYSHIESLQKDKASSSRALDSLSKAMSSLVDGNLITPEEARIEIAKYIDINPENPIGEYKSVTTKSNTNGKEQ